MLYECLLPDTLQSLGNCVLCLDRCCQAQKTRPMGRLMSGKPKAIKSQHVIFVF
jgi:hypothetical protein